MAVLQVGRDVIVQLIGNGLTGVEISGINIGQDNTAVSDGDTGLLNELDRQAGITSTTGTSSDELELVNTFDNNAGTVEEVGLYTDDTDDTQVSRQVVSPVNLESDDTLEVTMRLDVQDA